MNNVCIVGKVSKLPELKETNNGNKVASLEVEVERNFANSDGEVESDIFAVTLWKGLAESSLNICNVGSVVGIKGRLSARAFDTREGNKFYYCEIVAEKLSFISKSKTK